jgi:Xaa-Pro aminopeptidase
MRVMRWMSAPSGSHRSWGSAAGLRHAVRVDPVVLDDTIAVVAPKVGPGATTLDLVEEVEHQMRMFGSRVPSFTMHVFTRFVGGKNSAERRAAACQ